MKRAAVFSVVLFVGINSMAQVFEKVTIVSNGSYNNYINLVILGDGYTDGELSKFVTDATNFTNAFFNQIPYSYYQKYFNVIAVKVPSNESGASHPGTATDVTEPVIPVITVDNYFGSTFDYYGIHRLLVATKSAAISNVLAANFPNYDQALILVNSPYYGGSGGYYTVASLHTSSNQIAIHELGHSFAGLKDEYWAGDTYAGEGINMTKETNPSLVRWKNWYGINLIGIYPHCCGGTSSLWYKPHEYCLMQYLGDPFCSVCTQATIEKIHSLTPAVESYEPLNNNVNAIIFPVEFKLNLIAPSPNTLKIIWTLNGSFFKKNVDNIPVSESSLVFGSNTLNVTVEDTTELLKVDNHTSIHLSSVNWLINKDVTGIKDITSTSSQFIVDIYPNPVSEVINIRIQGDNAGKIKIEIYDLQGKKLKISSLYSDKLNSIDVHDLDQGIYFAKIFIDNNLIAVRKIIRK
jgi:hypothetical protein